MKINRNRLRIIYAALLIAAFFIPAYGNISALHFISQSFEILKTDPEITLIDIVVYLLPLIVIASTSLIILLLSIQQKANNITLLTLPFLSLGFLLLLLSFDLNRGMHPMHVLSLLKEMSFGFYMAASASLLLLFSYSRREALNFD